MEETITTKDELLEQAKELAESEDLSGVMAKVNALKRQWRRAGGEEESLYDKEMGDKFYAYIDQIAARESEIYSSVEEKKRGIIDKAKEVLKEGNFKKATAAMNDLMEEWKASGRAVKETDDALWEEFKAVRSEFFANKKSYFENLRESFAANKEAKEALIERAKEANTLESFKEIGKLMDELMEEWKKTGSAGRENDNELWAAFNGERKTFFSNRSQYYSKLRETFKERAEAKKDIIAQAKRLLAMSEFTEEEVAAVKDLRAKWKEVGNAGRDNEDELWNEFNAVLDKYFENLRYYRQ